MNIYTCHTPSHNVLFRKYFLATLPGSLKNVPHLLEPTGESDFLTRGFLRSIMEKMDLIIESIDANRGSAIIWSDVDIVFGTDPNDFIESLLQTQPDINLWFQRESPDPMSDVNVGFVVMRCMDSVKDLYQNAKDMMLDNPGWNDQQAINQLLRSSGSVSWDYLPASFVARSHGWPPQRDRHIYHANMTAGKDGVGQKIRQFEALDRMASSGWLSCRYAASRAWAKKVTGKLIAKRPG